LENFGRITKGAIYAKTHFYHFIDFCSSFVLLFSGCASPRITLFSDDTVPLQEFTLQGKGKGKILVIPIKGEISGSTSKGLIFTKPSMIQEVVSQLKQAEKDCYSKRHPLSRNSCL